MYEKIKYFTSKSLSLDELSEVNFTSQVLCSPNNNNRINNIGNHKPPTIVKTKLLSVAPRSISGRRCGCLKENFRRLSKYQYTPSTPCGHNITIGIHNIHSITLIIIKNT